ncbi:MAG TPA: MerR family transcriptional regulator [Candidatus Binatia bacterium]|nr:MerR family transcriptional regulator [Candidatus Binatia bacterium]
MGRRRKQAETGTFTVKQAAHIADLSPAMVDYLCRSGAITPSARNRPGHGRERLFDFSDLVMLRILAELLAAKVPVTRLARGLAVLRSENPGKPGLMVSARLLVTDGVSVYYRSPSEVLRELSSGQFAFQFVVKMDRVREYVERRLPAVAGSRRGG